MMSVFKPVAIVENRRTELSAFLLRVGLGLVFLFGGLSKLLQLLDASRQQTMVDQYLGPAGYVNRFFADFVFSKGVAPWFFLTSLSAFEVFSGLFLILGFLVRPLSLFYGFLLWTFVMSLPVVTAPGIELTIKTHTSPALLIQIRDIALSGLMFVLYNVGSGPGSLDGQLFRSPATRQEASWNHLGILLRLSLTFVFLVGGLFAGMDHIQTFSVSRWLLITIALWILSGEQSKAAGIAVIAMIAWYMSTKFTLDKSLLSNLNSVKREFAFIAAGATMAVPGGGEFFRLSRIFLAPRHAIAAAALVLTFAASSPSYAETPPRSSITIIEEYYPGNRVLVISGHRGSIVSNLAGLMSEVENTFKRMNMNCTNNSPKYCTFTARFEKYTTSVRIDDHYSQGPKTDVSITGELAREFVKLFEEAGIEPRQAIRGKYYTAPKSGPGSFQCGQNKHLGDEPYTCMLSEN